MIGSSCLCLRGYKLWIVIYANVLISALNGMVFIDFLCSEQPRIFTICSVDSNRSSYYTVISWEGGQTSRKYWTESIVIINSLWHTQQLIWSPSTLAFEKNSLMMISEYTLPLGFSNFVHVLSMKISGMEVSSRVSNRTTISMIIVAHL